MHNISFTQGRRTNIRTAGRFSLPVMLRRGGNAADSDQPISTMEVSKIMYSVTNQEQNIPNMEFYIYDKHV